MARGNSSKDAPSPPPMTDIKKSDTTIDVWVPVQSGGPYTYVTPQGLAPRPALVPGCVVRVPLGRRQVTGIVASVSRIDLLPDPTLAQKLKPVVAVLEIPPVPDSFLRFLLWVARYTCTPLGRLVKMALSGARTAPPRRVVYRLSEAARHQVPASPPRGRVYDVLASGGACSAAKLAAKAHVSTGLITRMARSGLLVRELED